MNRARLVAAGWVLWAAHVAVAQDLPTSPLFPQEPPLPVLIGQEGEPKKETPKTKPVEKKKEPTPEIQQPLVDFAELPPTAAEAQGRFNPHMIGDFLGSFRFQTINVPIVGTGNVTVPLRPNAGGVGPRTAIVPFTFRTQAQRQIAIPVAGQSGVKIGENESPFPQDRIYFGYHFFSNIQGPSPAAVPPRQFARNIDIRQLNLPPNAITAQPIIEGFVSLPGVQPVAPQADLHREVIGFEKTFFGGACSVGVRVPFFQLDGDDSISQDEFSDMTFIFKYAPFRGPDGVFSLGLAVTAPTGPEIPTNVGDIHSTLLQPFVGYLRRFGSIYVHGFSSVLVPTDSRDVTLLFNDLGLGYALYEGSQASFLRSVTPTLEIHVATPLTNTSEQDPIFAFDTAILTGGVHLGLGNNSVLTLAVGTPVTGPRPFSVEGIVQFNFRY